VEHLGVGGAPLRLEITVRRLESLRHYFDEWQAQGYANRPDWYDECIDNRINSLTNVELLELLDTVDLWLKKREWK